MSESGSLIVVVSWGPRRTNRDHLSTRACLLEETSGLRAPSDYSRSASRAVLLFRVIRHLLHLALHAQASGLAGAQPANRSPAVQRVVGLLLISDSEGVSDGNQAERCVW